MFKFGIIGAGKIARKFCDAVRCIDGAEVVGVSSKDIDKAEKFAKEENIDYFGSYENMLKDCAADAIYIATTHNFHHDNAILCLNHRKPILIEKPMVLNKKEAESIFKLAKEKNLFVMEAMWSRFLQPNQKAREWIAGGAIGKPSVANFLTGFKANPDPKERYFNPEIAGGAIYDIGVYAFEIITYIINQPIRETQSMTIPAETGVDMTDAINIKFDTCIANLLMTFAANVPSSALICGTEGYIQIPNAITGNECFLYKDGKLAEHFKYEFKNGFVFEIEEVIRCIREGLLESPIVPHSDTLACCEVFDLTLGLKHRS